MLNGCVPQGLAWLASLQAQGWNGILADEMGLGKTCQVSMPPHSTMWSSCICVPKWLAQDLACSCSCTMMISVESPADDCLPATRCPLHVLPQAWRLPPSRGNSCQQNMAMGLQPCAASCQLRLGLLEGWHLTHLVLPRLQVIALMAHLMETCQPSPGPFLVVVPASLIANWEAELAAFAPSLRVHTYRGPAAQRAAAFNKQVLPMETASQ